MTKYVYDFSEGNKDMKDLLGGKGANLAEMTNMGLPVPPGFTITTEACLTFLANGGAAPPEMLGRRGELPAPRPDETRLATLVEGATPDAEMASFVFIEERGAGRLLFGGFFPDGSSLALHDVADPAAAIAPLDASGLFTAGSLRARPLLHIV